MSYTNQPAKTLITIIFCFLASASLFAKERRQTDTKNGAAIAPTVLLAVTDNETLSGFYAVKNETHIELKIDDYTGPFNWYTYHVDLKVYPMTSSGNYLPAYSVGMDIENNRYGGMGEFVDMQVHNIPGAIYGAKVEVISVQTHDQDTGTTTNLTPANVSLTVAFETERYYTLPTTLSGVSSTLSTSLNTLTINWNAVAQAEEYEVEWTWVDNYNDTTLASSLGTSGITLTVKEFERNCTRVQTKANSYVIPSIYSRGYIVYRIRAIGRFADSLNYNKKVYGNWSVTPNPTQPTLNSWGSSNYKLVAEHEAYKKNWQLQASYAEDGKKKEVISYFDGTLRNRQTVTKINTDNQAIVGEVIYDEEGRPSAEILPVPTGSAALKFYSGFNRVETTNLPYSYLDMTTDAIDKCNMTIKGLSDTYGAGKYYSNSSAVYNNYQDYVPNAEKYPFSQIEYTLDNTGRVKRKSGVGKKYTLGSGHEMKYIYTTPAQEELNRLFGYSVGYVSHYKKNIVRDPNGQLSISYLDPQGRTIATALGADTPPNMDPLEDEIDSSQHGLVEFDLLNKLGVDDPDTLQDNNELFLSSNYYGNLYDGLRYDAQKAFLNDSQEYSFDYSLKQNHPFSYLCQSNTYRYPFIYDLVLEITNECGEITQSYDQHIGNYTVSNGLVNLVGSSYSLSEDPAPIETLLPIGSYGISKRLTVDQEALEVFANDYIARGIQSGCILSPQDPQVDVTDCFKDCEECVAFYTNLTQQGYVSDKLAQNFELNQLQPGTGDYNDLKDLLIVRYEREWELLIEECQKPCKNDGYVINPSTGSGNNLSSMTCDNSLSTLMSDMLPSGQYGIYQSNVDENGDVILNDLDPDVSTLPMSIYNEQNEIYAVVEGTNPNNISWRFPHYFGDLGPSAANSDYQHYFTDETTGYLEIAYVNVILDEVSGEYNPPVTTTASNILLPVAGSGNLYKIEPQYLANLDDFLTVLASNPHWTRSLVKYHPEFHYLDYKYKMCDIQHTIGSASDINLSQIGTGVSSILVNSDGFDAFLGSFDNFQDAFDAGLFTDALTLFDNDPYFLYTHPMDGSIVDVTTTDAQGNVQVVSTAFTPADFLELKRSIMLQALGGTSSDPYVNSAPNDGYDGSSGKTMLRIIYETVRCSGNDYACDLNTNNFTTIMNKVALFTDEEKDLFWQYYASYYFSLKQKIQHVFVNLHAARQGFYNDCIGNENSNNTNTISSVISAYPSERNQVNTWISTPSATLFSENSNYLTDKEKRFLPYDEQYDSEQNTGEIYEEMLGSVNSEIYQQTGQCPMVRDLMIFLDGAVKKPGLTTVFNGSTPSPQPVINFLTPALMQGLGMNYSSTTLSVNSFTISGTISNGGKKLSINLTQSPTSPSFIPLVLNIPATSSLTWNTYGSTWTIEGMSQIAGTGYNTSTQLYGYVILADVSPSTGENYDLVITGTTKAPLTCSNTAEGLDPNDPGMVVIDPAESGSCNRKEYFANALRDLIIDLKNAGTINSTSGVDLLNNGTFMNGFLPEFFHCQSNTYIRWVKLTNGNNYTIRIGNDPTSYLISMKLSLNLSSTLVSLSINGLSSSGNTHDVIATVTNGGVLSTIAGTISNSLNDKEPLNFACCSPSNGNNYYTIEEYFTASKNVYNEIIDLVVYNYDNGLPIPSTYTSPNVEILSNFYSNEDFGIYNLSYHSTEKKITFNHGIESLSSCNTLGTIDCGEYFGNNIRIENVDNSLLYNYALTGSLVVAYLDFTFTNNVFQEEAITRIACGKPVSYIPTCPCIPQQIQPVAAEDKYPVYSAHLASYGLTNYMTVDGYSDVQVFKNFNMQYLVDGYMYYLSALGITSSNYSTHPQYIDMLTFGSSDLNYGYNNYNTVIDAFDAQLSGSNPITNWIEYVTYYLEQNPGICPPAPMIPKMSFPVTIGNDCVEFNLNVAEAYNAAAYDAYIQSKKDAFKEAYLADALGTVNESFKLTYYDKEYQYTLYYYDQAGNLIQTVAPKGVNRMAANKNNQINAHRATNGAENTTLLPGHTFRTQYRYNSLNQLVWQQTPDGGVTRFAYDKLGRIIASQNAMQAVQKRFSYTRYDGLGRIFESGYFTLSTVTINDTGRLVFTSNGALVDTDAVSANYPFNLVNTLNEVVRTNYDDYGPFNPDTYLTPLASGETRKTRNRVTSIATYPSLSGSTNLINDLETLIIYNYDIHGNVDEMAKAYNLWDYSLSKKIKYEYDLISGNVNKVIYQAGQSDQFIHKYEYDADNRITNVLTSKDGVIWERDANYKYYQHGPLAKTTIGDKEVQGVDYSYTLQGWLKTVNAENFNNEVNDIGRDGNHVSKDAFGFSLTYHEGDYKPRKTDMGLNQRTNNISEVYLQGTDLYNGNIKRMNITTRSIDETVRASTYNVYSYDQLNRITSMLSYDINAIDSGYLHKIPTYNSSYRYDANGNILTLDRWAPDNAGTFSSMDELVYSYNTINNRLLGVVDNTGLSNNNKFSNDIDEGTNYSYNVSGQLTSDSFEQVYVYWHNNGKVALVDNYKSGISTYFHYDGLGNRVSKFSDYSGGDDKYTFYFHDAQGNVMAVYDKDKIKEHHIYGSSRLGVQNYSGTSVNPSLFNRLVGDKRYELSNHLGNVLTVVTDRKLTDLINDGKVIVSDPDFTQWDKITGTESINIYSNQMEVTTQEPSGVYGSYDVSGQPMEVSFQIYLANLAEVEFYIMNPDGTIYNNDVVPINAPAFTPVPFSYYFYPQQVGTYRFFVQNTNYENTGFALYQFEIKQSLDNQVADNDFFGNFKPDVIEFNDYYPFGMLVHGRYKATSQENHRYGFQGQERDDEVKGAGNSYNFTYRMYDPRVGRFFAVDPLFKEYPSLTPYQFASNSLIDMIEIEGLEGGWIVNAKGIVTYAKLGPVADRYFDSYDEAQLAAMRHVTKPSELKKINLFYNEFVSRTPTTQRPQAEIRQQQTVAEKYPDLVRGTAMAPYMFEAGKEIVSDAVGAGIVDHTADLLKIYKTYKTAKQISNTKKIIDKTEDFVKIVDQTTENYQQVKSFWNKTINFKGTKVYQRNDIFDINKVSSWKEKGKTITGTNLERMKSGRAPVGIDGKPVNLHHGLQTNDSNLYEMTQSFHQTNSKTIHINDNSIPSGIDRGEFNTFRSEYWINRAKDF